MGTMLSTTSPIPTTELRAFYTKVLLRAAQPELLHTRFGQEDVVPLNYGPQIQFRKFANLARATSALTEGSSGANTAFSITAVIASLGQYGQWVEGTELLQARTIDDIIAEVTTKLGEAAGDTIDVLTRNILIAGTNVQRESAQAESRMYVASLLTVTALRKAVRTLKTANAKPFKFGNKLRYVAIAHPNALYDLLSDSTLSSAMQYGYGSDLSENKANLIDGQIAPVLDVVGVRIFETTNASVLASYGWSAGDVYNTLVIAKDAYGVVKQTGMSMQTYYTPADTPDKSDPLHQRWILGWKACHTAVILNEDNMVRIEHGSSADALDSSH